MEFLTNLVPPNFEFQVQYLAIILITVGILYIGYLKIKASSSSIPPGSLGFPLIGETISFLMAQKQDKSKQWFEIRVQKYGPVFKTSLVGSPIVVLTGQAANKFIFSANDAIAGNQMLSTATIFGKYSIFEVEGSRRKLIKSAMMNFLKPESIQKIIVEMDSIVKKYLLKELEGKESVQFVPLIKKVTFKVTSTLLFGLHEGWDKEKLFEDLTIAFRGLWAIPLRIPGTKFRKACQARDRVCKTLSKLIKTRKEDMEEGKMGSQQDMISTFLSLRDEEGKPLLEEEIIDNLITLIFASQDTSSCLVCLFFQYLGRDTNVYNKVLEEHKEIAKTRVESDGKLKWSEMQSMKYTWKAVQELMRLKPPLSGNFRYVTRDISFGGYDIPKGWRILWVAFPTHMDPEIFDEPEKFQPSRFEGPSKSVPPYTYIPFGAGSRICPGSEFARIDVLLIIHHLVTNYGWTPLIPNEPLIHDPMPYPAKGLPVRLQPMLDQENTT